ncbi:MCE family protein [Actinomadura sp. HBU206391]|uniref:MCE family protein n=1 Tax=Actinomadura sp. HBU206391 TaxID=2731692 RepID=UPI00164F5149|nr:MCE family protein [Actinomadura sp. HBU206391]MBC6461603.1 MCE family protein [Actinomadura sp. HBU206391]
MKRESLAGPLTKSIIFVVVTVLATAVLAISIANTGVGRTVGYQARFSDVTGLNRGDGVRVAGVRVGQVDEIGVVDRRVAMVRFSVQADRRLPASVTATIKYLNLVGQRYIELGQGVGPVDRALRPGDTIPLERTTPALDLTQLFNGFQPLFQALSPKDVNQLAGGIIQVFQGEGTTVDSLITSLGSLTGTLATKDQVIGQVIDNLNSVLDTVNARDDRLGHLITTLQRLVSGLAADRRPIGEAISAMSDLTGSTAGLLQAGRAPLKQDITELGRLSRNLANDSPTVEVFLRRLPVKMQAITRLASYGSWLNFYLCEATVTGVGTSDGSPPPTGIPITERRCER